MDETKKQSKDEVIDETVTENVTDETTELEVLQVQYDESEGKYRRALADYQNLQKRSQEDRLLWIRTANKELLLKILVIFDTLEMAYQHSQDKNIQVSIQQFLDVLKSEGVTKIETVGKKFDPNVMEAITTGEGKEGIVLQELRVGFMIHESLLRAAQVTVGKGKE
jgi:molecular chaperone GrpE